MCLAIAASQKCIVYQLDVNNAFLHGNLNEEVYMRMPEGVENRKGKVCLLKKSLYGLKQASRQWHNKLLEELKSLGYVQSKNDYSLFTKRTSHFIVIVTVYVDDILITGSNQTEIKMLKAHLHNKFTIKDFGQMHYFLGMEVSHNPEGMVLTQHKFTRDLFKTSGVSDFKKAVIPMSLNHKLSSTDGELLEDPSTYRSIIGKLNFLTNTRPDLSYTVQTLSQFMQKTSNITLAGSLTCS